MPNESIVGLNIHSGNDVVDATYGGGGHSRLILNELGEGRLFAFDQDEDAAGNTLEDNRLFFIRHNFRYIKNFLRFYNVNEVDSIFADLGVSSHDFDIPEEEMEEDTIGELEKFEKRLVMALKRNNEEEEKETFGATEDYKEIGDRIHKKYFLEV